MSARNDTIALAAWVADLDPSLEELGGGIVAVVVETKSGRTLVVTTAEVDGADWTVGTYAPDAWEDGDEADSYAHLDDAQIVAHLTTEATR
jgi:hypothetical protein